MNLSITPAKRRAAFSAGTEVCVDEVMASGRKTDPDLSVEITTKGNHTLQEFRRSELAAAMKVRAAALREGSLFKIQQDGTARDITQERLEKVRKINQKLAER